MGSTFYRPDKAGKTSRRGEQAMTLSIQVVRQVEEEETILAFIPIRMAGDQPIEPGVPTEPVSPPSQPIEPGEPTVPDPIPPTPVADARSAM
jgi:hypothetical protein